MILASIFSTLYLLFLPIGPQGAGASFDYGLTTRHAPSLTTPLPHIRRHP